MLGARPTLKPLSSLELLGMDTLWKRGSATSEELRHALAVRHPMKESTTRTVLKRLEEKGYVRREVAGRVFVYSGAEEPHHLAGKAVRQILDRFCGGSVERLLLGMVTSEVVDQQELERLARQIALRNRREA